MLLRGVSIHLASSSPISVEVCCGEWMEGVVKLVEGGVLNFRVGKIGERENGLYTYANVQGWVKCVI